MPDPALRFRSHAPAFQDAGATARAWDGDPVASVDGWAVTDGDPATRREFPDELIPAADTELTRSGSGLLGHAEWVAFVRDDRPFDRDGVLYRETGADGSSIQVRKTATGFAAVEAAGPGGADPVTITSTVRVHGDASIVGGSARLGTAWASANTTAPRVICSVTLSRPIPNLVPGGRLAVSGAGAPFDRAMLPIVSYDPRTLVVEYLAAGATGAGAAPSGGTARADGSFEAYDQEWSGDEIHCLPAVLEVRRSTGGVVEFLNNGISLGGGTDAALPLGSSAGATARVGDGVAIPTEVRAYSAALSGDDAATARLELSCRPAALDTYAGHSGFVAIRTLPGLDRAEFAHGRIDAAWVDAATGELIAGRAYGGSRAGLGKGWALAAPLFDRTLATARQVDCHVAVWAPAWAPDGTRAADTLVGRAKVATFTRRPPAAIRYADFQAGSDSNPGTSGSPAKTIGAALGLAGRGGTVVVRGTHDYQYFMGAGPYQFEGEAGARVRTALTGSSDYFTAVTVTQSVHLAFLGVDILHAVRPQGVLGYGVDRSRGLTIREWADHLDSGVTGGSVVGLEDCSHVHLFGYTSAPSSTPGGYPFHWTKANEWVVLDQAESTRPVATEHALRAVSLRESAVRAYVVDDGGVGGGGPESFSLRGAPHLVHVAGCDLGANYWLQAQPPSNDYELGNNDARTPPTGLVVEDCAVEYGAIKAPAGCRLTNVSALAGALAVDDAGYVPDEQPGGVGSVLVAGCTAEGGLSVAAGLARVDPGTLALANATTAAGVTGVPLAAPGLVAVDTGDGLVAIRATGVVSGGTAPRRLQLLVDGVPMAGATGDSCLVPLAAGTHTLALRATDAAAGQADGAATTIAVAGEGGASVTEFKAVRNNASSVVAAAHAAGSGTLVLADAARFAGDDGKPFRVTCTAGRGATEVVRSILLCTGRSGNTLAVAGAIEGTTDVDLPPGTRVEMRWTRGAVEEIHEAIAAIEAGGVIDLSGYVAGVPDGLTLTATGAEPTAPAEGDLWVDPDGEAAGDAVASVDGRTGAVTLDDLYAAATHTHAIADTTGLQSALDGKLGSAFPVLIGTQTHDGASSLQVRRSAGLLVHLIADGANPAWFKASTGGGSDAFEFGVAGASGQFAASAQAGDAIFKFTGDTFRLCSGPSGEVMALTVDGATGVLTGVGSGLTGLDASALASGTVPAARLPASGVTPGSYTAADLTVDATGRITAVASGAGGGGGTVTSVGLSVPAWLSVSGSPVTTAGTLAVAAATGQAANRVLATPDGTTGAVALRALAAADLPDLSATYQPAGSYAAASHTHAIADTTGLQSALDGKASTSHTHDAADVTAGTLAVARGGTGAGTADGAKAALAVSEQVAFSFGLDGAAPAANATTANSRRVARAHTLVSASIHLESAAAVGTVTGSVEFSTDGGATWTGLWAGNTANRPSIASGQRTGTTTSFDATSGAAGTRYRGKLIAVDGSTQVITIELEYR